MDEPIQHMLDGLPMMVWGSACHFLFVFLTSWPGVILMLVLVAEFFVKKYQRTLRQIERMDQPRRSRQR